MSLALQRGRRFELQMLESFDLKDWYSTGRIHEWWKSGGITAIESKNQVVIHDQRTVSDPWSLYMFQNNLDGGLVETRMDAPCQHNPFWTPSLITVIQNGKELLAVLCDECKDIKVIDMETKQVTSVFKSPTDLLRGMCSGPDGGLFVAFQGGNIKQLDSSFNTINTFNSCVTNIIYDMCHLPAPHNTLVVEKRTELMAVSVQDGHQVWSPTEIGFVAECLLYCSQQDVLLVSKFYGTRVHVVNPRDGSTLQTIYIPNIDYIHTMCLCYDQIVMLQQTEKGNGRMLLSYYSLK